LSSHHLNDLDTLCTRIAVLHNRTLAALDSPEQLKSKYSNTQELIVESFPGNYDAVLRRLRADGIVIRKEGTSLIIETVRPERMIAQVVSALEQANESLLDIKLIKPSLDAVFLEIAGKRVLAAAPAHQPRPPSDEESRPPFDRLQQSMKSDAVHARTAGHRGTGGAGDASSLPGNNVSPEEIRQFEQSASQAIRLAPIAPTEPRKDTGVDSRKDTGVDSRRDSRAYAADRESEKRAAGHLSHAARRKRGGRP
jgi:hypothetical protein